MGENRGNSAKDCVRCCPALPEWPQSWMGDERDLLPGQKLVEYLTPVLVHLAGSGLSKKTIQKRVDDLQETPKLRKSPVHEVVDTVLEYDGPLLYHRDSEERQCPCSPPVVNSAASGLDSSVDPDPPTDSPDEPAFISTSSWMFSTATSSPGCWRILKLPHWLTNSLLRPSPSRASFATSSPSMPTSA